MQRKPGYPVANCSIKMPENVPSSEAMEEEEPPQRRQQLINFGHAQWGFNNWSWAVSKQDLDFVDLTCGKYTAGVAAFVSISLKTFDIHRENVGYGTALAHSKGLAIHRARKCAVTNALRETLLSFGGSVASELLELDTHKELPVPPPAPAPAPEPLPENNPNLANKSVPPPADQKHSPLAKNTRKDDCAPLRTACPPAKNAVAAPPPVAKALPIPANLPPAANRVPQPPRAPPPAAPHPAPPHPHAVHARPNSNEVRGDGEEARAERKRRQRLAQEEFRLKQLHRQGQDEKQELDSISTSVDNLLMAIPTPGVNTEGPGNTDQSAKRKSPAPDDGAPKRRATALSRLDAYD